MGGGGRVRKKEKGPKGGEEDGASYGLYRALLPDRPTFLFYHLVLVLCILLSVVNAAELILLVTCYEEIRMHVVNVFGAKFGAKKPNGICCPLQSLTAYISCCLHSLMAQSKKGSNSTSWSSSFLRPIDRLRLCA